MTPVPFYVEIVAPIQLCFRIQGISVSCNGTLNTASVVRIPDAYRKLRQSVFESGSSHLLHHKARHRYASRAS